MKYPPRYVAEIRQVREIAVHGLADLGYWSDRLQPQGLDPVSDDSRAQLVLTAVAAKWMGSRFRELSIGVLARAQWNVGHEEGIYLAHAFNSSRLLAFCERTLFRTPYFHADIRLDAGLPLSITVASSKQKLLEVKMQDDQDAQANAIRHRELGRSDLSAVRSSTGRRCKAAFLGEARR